MPILSILPALIIMFSQPLSGTIVLPLFSDTASQEVTAVLGEDVQLHCQVDHLGHHTVSWIRQSDLHILTVGSHKFTTDKRISVKHDSRNKDFILIIRHLSIQDCGLYECQINTSPVKIRVVALHSAPITPKIRNSPNKDSRKPPKLELPENHGSSTSIIGAPDIYFQEKSLVNITCMVNSLQEPEHIFWYHDGEVISYYSSRGGISIVRKMGMEKSATMSSLIIREAGLEDQGTYTCRPLTGDFKTAKTRLFIGYGGVSGASVSRAERKDLGAWFISIASLSFYSFLM